MFNSLKRIKVSLVEMMIVIAIMGILSAVVSASLVKARPKARLGSAQAQLSSLHPSLVICQNDLQEVDFTAVAPVVGDKICSTAK